MKRYKRYVLGSALAGFLAFVLMAPAGSAEAFWGFGKSKKENNINYTGAVANSGSSSSISKSSITVVSPNGGEILKAGQSYKIKWTSKNIQKDGVLNIAVVEKETGVNNYIADNIDVKKNNYAWKIPLSLASGEYKIRVFCTIKGFDYGCSGESKDESDNFFSIVAKTNTVGISVISPNGGEKWKIGETRNVKWKKQNIPADSRIDLEVLEEGMDRDFITVIAHGLSATSTSHEWSIKNTGNVKGDKNYRVIVRALKFVDGGYELLAEDVSNNSFYIGNGVAKNSL